MMADTLRRDDMRHTRPTKPPLPTKPRRLRTAYTIIWWANDIPRQSKRFYSRAVANRLAARLTLKRRIEHSYAVAVKIR